MQQSQAWPFPVGTHVYNTATATENGIKFMHLNSNFTDLRCSLAYRWAKYPRKGKMLEVAVTYKHPKDNHNKQVARQSALGKFSRGETIFIPIGKDANAGDLYMTMYNMFIGSIDNLTVNDESYS